MTNIEQDESTLITILNYHLGNILSIFNPKELDISISKIPNSVIGHKSNRYDSVSKRKESFSLKILANQCSKKPKSVDFKYITRIFNSTKDSSAGVDIEEENDHTINQRKRCSSQISYIQHDPINTNSQCKCESKPIFTAKFKTNSQKEDEVLIHESFRSSSITTPIAELPSIPHNMSSNDSTSLISQIINLCDSPDDIYPPQQHSFSSNPISVDSPILLSTPQHSLSNRRIAIDTLYSPSPLPKYLSKSDSLSYHSSPESNLFPRFTSKLQLVNQTFGLNSFTPLFLNTHESLQLTYNFSSNKNKNKTASSYVWAREYGIQGPVKEDLLLNSQSCIYSSKLSLENDITPDSELLSFFYAFFQVGIEKPHPVKLNKISLQFTSSNSHSYSFSLKLNKHNKYPPGSTILPTSDINNPLPKVTDLYNSDSKNTLNFNKCGTGSGMSRSGSGSGSAPESNTPIFQTDNVSFPLHFPLWYPSAQAQMSINGIFGTLTGNCTCFLDYSSLPVTNNNSLRMNIFFSNNGHICPPQVCKTLTQYLMSLFPWHSLMGRITLESQGTLNQLHLFSNSTELDAIARGFHFISQPLEAIPLDSLKIDKANKRYGDPSFSSLIHLRLLSRLYSLHKALINFDFMQEESLEIPSVKFKMSNAQDVQYSQEGDESDDNQASDDISDISLEDYSQLHSQIYPNHENMQADTDSTIDCKNLIKQARTDLISEILYWMPGEINFIIALNGPCLGWCFSFQDEMTNPQLQTSSISMSPYRTAIYSCWKAVLEKVTTLEFPLFSSTNSFATNLQQFHYISGITSSLTSMIFPSVNSSSLGPLGRGINRNWNSNSNFNESTTTSANNNSQNVDNIAGAIISKKLGFDPNTTLHHDDLVNKAQKQTTDKLWSVFHQTPQSPSSMISPDNHSLTTFPNLNSPDSIPSLLETSFPNSDKHVIIPVMDEGQSFCDPVDFHPESQSHSLGTFSQNIVSSPCGYNNDVNANSCMSQQSNEILKRRSMEQSKDPLTQHSNSVVHTNTNVITPQQQQQGRYQHHHTLNSLVSQNSQNFQSAPNRIPTPEISNLTRLNDNFQYSFVKNSSELANMGHINGHRLLNTNPGSQDIPKQIAFQQQRIPYSAPPPEVSFQDQNQGQGQIQFPPTRNFGTFGHSGSSLISQQTQSQSQNVPNIQLDNVYQRSSMPPYRTRNDTDNSMPMYQRTLTSVRPSSMIYPNNPWFYYEMWKKKKQKQKLKKKYSKKKKR